ncbi:hypothetical protein EVAR_10731_1 [Eumeta japonica]|uniref:Uncharacterized protein n=1 Tax=Eumeta variegata TaxID=151549 RepID=A0A4C1U7C4_EUMVA|nr:hypothetical protein EVAR_10731_1 [Eumeta japonica]
MPWKVSRPYSVAVFYDVGVAPRTGGFCLWNSWLHEFAIIVTVFIQIAAENCNWDRIGDKIKSKFRGGTKIMFGLNENMRAFILANEGRDTAPRAASPSGPNTRGRAVSGARALNLKCQGTRSILRRTPLSVHLRRDEWR